MNGNCVTGTIAEAWYFAYDGDGVRVSTAHDLNGNVTVSAYYFGGSYEVRGAGVLDANHGIESFTTVSTIKYYSLGGQTVMRDDDGLHYRLTDHLGSVVAITDEDGTLTSEQRYLPFGQVRTDAGVVTQTDLGYTGQRKLDAGMGGIMDYKARFYSTYTNRFIQPDTVIPSPANPQSFNRYSYVGNNPVNFSDPSGHCIICTALSFIAPLAVNIASVVMLGTSPDTAGVFYAELFVENTGDTTSTYTAGGIAVQGNYYPLGEFTRDNRYKSGLGLAQVSQYQLDNELEMKGADPTDPKVAVAAMQKRISLVTDMCSGHQITCSSTDRFIAAALAQNAGFKKESMRDLVNGVYGNQVTSDPTKNFLPWDNFLKHGDNTYNRLMLRMFKNDVQELGNSGWHVPDDIDWEHIDRLSEGGWRNSW